MGQGGGEGEGEEEEEGGTTGGAGAMEVEVEVEVGIKICEVVNRRLWQLRAEWESGEGGERDGERDGEGVPCGVALVFGFWLWMLVPSVFVMRQYASFSFWS